MSTKQLVYPPKQTAQEYRWYCLQSPPPNKWNKFALPGESGRIVWLQLTPNIAAILIKNGWKELS